MVVLLSGLPCTVLETGDPMGGSSCLTQWTGVPQHPAQSVQEVTSNNNSRSVIQVQFVTRSVQAGSRERVTAGGRRGPKPHQRYRLGGGVHKMVSALVYIALSHHPPHQQSIRSVSSQRHAVDATGTAWATICRPSSTQWYSAPPCIIMPSAPPYSTQAHFSLHHSAQSNGEQFIPPLSKCPNPGHAAFLHFRLVAASVICTEEAERWISRPHPRGNCFE